MLALIFTLAACGGNNKSSTSSKPSTDTNSKPSVEVNPEEKPIKLLNVGSDPNNAYQSKYSPVFDENFIYFPSDGIYKVDYEGNNLEQISKKDACHLNLADSYIYYAQKTGIYRLNIADLSEEKIINININENILELFLVEDYLLYVIEDEKEDNCYSYAYSLKDGKKVFLKKTLGDDYQTDVYFSVDDKNVYLFEYSTVRAKNGSGVLLYQFPINDIKNAADNADLSGTYQFISTTRAKPTSWLIAPNGIYDLDFFGSSSFTHTLNFRNYNTINFEKNEWKYVEKSKLTGDELCRYIGHGTPYIVGNSLLIFDTRYNLDEYDMESEIYYFEDCDLNKGKMLSEVSYERVLKTGSQGTSGVYNETFYLILPPDSKTVNAFTILSVSKDGTLKTIDCK